MNFSSAEPDGVLKALDDLLAEQEAQHARLLLHRLADWQALYEFNVRLARSAYGPESAAMGWWETERAWGDLHPEIIPATIVSRYEKPHIPHACTSPTEPCDPLLFTTRSTSAPSSNQRVGSKSPRKSAARNGRNAGVVSLLKCGVKNSHARRGYPCYTSTFGRNRVLAQPRHRCRGCGCFTRYGDGSIGGDPETWKGWEGGAG
jgi:hypothetical protein